MSCLRSPFTISVPSLTLMSTSSGRTPGSSMRTQWVRMELPGVRPEDVDISVSDGTLIVKGERKQDIEEQCDGLIRRERAVGSFERHVLLPEGTDPSRIEASYDLGVLELRIPH